MHGRRKIDDQLGMPMIVETEEGRFPFTECHTYAEIANLQAGIHDSVLKTYDGRFIRMTVVSDSNTVGDAFGVLNGWYTARIIDIVEARKWREGWGVLAHQPDPPMGPWAD